AARAMLVFGEAAGNADRFELGCPDIQGLAVLADDSAVCDRLHGQYGPCHCVAPGSKPAEAGIDLGSTPAMGQPGHGCFFRASKRNRPAEAGLFRLKMASPRGFEPRCPP